MKTLPHWLTPLLLGLGVGLLVFFLLPDPDPEIRYNEVTVADTVLLRSEPDTIVRWRERIVYRRVEADQVATAPAAAEPDVAAFCGAAGWYREQVARADTLVQEVYPSSVLLLRSFAYDRGDLTLIGPKSNGDLWRGDFRVGSRFHGRVAGDSVFIQTHRWDGLSTWANRALWLAGGAAVGYLANELR